MAVVEPQPRELASSAHAALATIAELVDTIVENPPSRDAFVSRLLGPGGGGTRHSLSFPRCMVEQGVAGPLYDRTVGRNRPRRLASHLLLYEGLLAILTIPFMTTIFYRVTEAALGKKGPHRGWIRWELYRVEYYSPPAYPGVWCGLQAIQEKEGAARIDVDCTRLGEYLILSPTIGYAMTIFISHYRGARLRGAGAREARRKASVRMVEIMGRVGRVFGGSLKLSSLTL